MSEFKSHSGKKSNIVKGKNRVSNKGNGSVNFPFKDDEIKQTITQLLPKYHRAEKELLKEMKRYYSEEKSGYIIPYEIGKKLFLEEAGGFCKNKETGKIRYNSNYWKAMFESPDRPKCDYEKEDLLISFHIHPYGYPRFSVGDLLVAIQYPQTWSVVGGGTSYNKRILCIKPKKGETFEKLMGKLYGIQWKKYIGKYGGIQKESEYEKLLPFSLEDSSYLIFIEKEERHILPNDLERDVYHKQKKWLEESGLFDIIEFECKDNEFIKVRDPLQKIKVSEEKIKFLEQKMFERHGKYDIFFDPSPIKVIQEDIELYMEEEYYRKESFDFAGVVTFYDYEIERVPGTILSILHTSFTIEDDTGEITLELSQITNDPWAMTDESIVLDKLIRSGEMLGKYVRVERANPINERVLKIKEKGNIFIES